MAQNLSRRATALLNLLPFAHLAARTAPAPHIALASAALRHPIARRLPARFTTIATVGLAVFAAVSFINSVKKPSPAKGVLTPNGEVERSSAT